MQVVEIFIEGKYGNNEICEDGIFISDNFAAVIDGATAKTPVRYDGKTSGRIAMEVIQKKISSFSIDIEAKSAIKEISDALSNFYKENSIYERLKVRFDERPTASVIIYSVYHKEIWIVGDCQALVDGRHITNEKLVDAILSEARALYISAEIENGVSIKDLMINDTGRAFITPMLEKQGIFQNSKNKSQYSHGVIDGFEVMEEDIKIFKIDDAKNVVLATDGYPNLFETLEDSEKYLSHIIKVDPLCFVINKSTKGFVKGSLSFDDRAYLSFSI